MKVHCVRTAAVSTSKVRSAKFYRKVESIPWASFLFGIIFVLVVFLYSNDVYIQSLHDESLFLGDQRSEKNTIYGSFDALEENENLQLGDVLDEINDDDFKLIHGDTDVTGANATRQTVCVAVIQANKLHASIFRYKQLDRWGSGKYHYRLKKDSDNHCPRDSPRIGMVNILKQTMTRDGIYLNPEQKQGFDIFIASGDEFCALHDSSFDFRQYYSHKNPTENITLSEDETLTVPMYMPLGYRQEFEHVDAVKKATARKWLFNFVGSLTSDTRQDLRRHFQKKGSLAKYIHNKNVRKNVGFVKVIDAWKQNVNTGGYLSPHRYRNLLLNSKFTLCPAGHNPEAYRIYEGMNRV